jgi:hypothetical protein
VSDSALLFVSGRNFLEDNNNHQDIVNYLKGLSLEDLTTTALRVDAYYRQKNGIKRQGGLHDLLRFMNNDDIVNWILNKIEELPELQSVAALRNLNNSNLSLLLLAEADLVAYLNTLPRSKLIDIALDVELYDRRKQHITTLGGLYNRVPYMSYSNLIKWILEKVELYPELNSIDALKNLNTENGDDNDTTNQLSKNFNLEKLKKSGRDKLIDYVLALEAYHRRVLNINVKGGLADYITIFSSQEIVNKVIEFLVEHPEIDTLDKLDQLAANEGFVGNQYETQLEALLNKEDIEKLKRIALAIEDFDIKIHNTAHIHRIHDKINTLTRRDLVQFIQHEIDEHDEYILSIDELKDYVDVILNN